MAYPVEVGESKWHSASKYGKSDVPVIDVVRLGWLFNACGGWSTAECG